MIKNVERSKQITEFIDKDHKVADELYELSNSDISIEQFKRRIKQLITEDPFYFDSYFILANILIEENRFKRAKDVLQEGFQKAIERIVNKDGMWPQIMEWGLVENRHIIRIIDKWAMELWNEGKTQEALTLFRNLLKTNIHLLISHFYIQIFYYMSRISMGAIVR